MALSFIPLKKSSIIFKQLSGVSIVEFEKVVEKINGGWKELEAQKKSHGQNAHLASLI